jgi:hypothetical protein
MPTMAESQHSCLFAKFLLGPHGSIQRRIKTEAKRWAAHYELHGAFPEPTSEEVAPGSVIYCNEVSDFNRRASHWRVYFLTHLRGEIGDALAFREAATYEFESFVGRFGWGMLYALTRHPAPNSALVTSQRIGTALELWPALSGLRYVDRDASPIAWSQLLVNHLSGPLAMWTHDGSINQANLRLAARQMATASESEIHTRIIERLKELAETDSRVKHREALCDATLLRERLGTFDSHQLADLSGGHTGSLLRTLYLIDESI